MQKKKSTKSIGEVAKEVGVETHSIRFWESKFQQIQPEIGVGSRRYYDEDNIQILKTIKHFLYEEGYTIEGLQKLFAKNDAKKLSRPKIESISPEDLNINPDDILLKIENIKSKIEKISVLSSHK